MQKYWIIWILFVGCLAPSMQVIMTPCQVRNIETQPKFATSLPRRALVQVVQIPPVFTQKVMVGRCVNATSEISGAPGSYFVCKQRYSSVELYITENTSLAGITQFYNQNVTIQGILDKFKQSQFVREFVVVESGCDFTFNLLPLLLQRNQQQASTYQTPTENLPSSAHDTEEPHRFHFLKSPYHSTQQQHATPPSTAAHQLINYPPTNIQDQKQQPSHSPVPYTTPSGPIPAHSYSHYPQGGNVNYGEGDRRAGGNTGNNNHSTGTIYNYVTPDSPTPSYYQPRGTYGEDSSTVQGRGKIGQGHHSSDHNHTTTHHKSTAQISTSTTTPEPEPESKPDLYNFSDKIGVPLYILSPEIDPLLKNIEGDSYYSVN